MARSINDWFQDHSDPSLGDRLDDEAVERAAPWDLQAAGMSTTRSERGRAGSGSRRGSRGRGDGGSAAKRTGGVPAPRSTGSNAKKSGRRQSSKPQGPATEVEATIRRIAKANPGVGYKRIARHLRDHGINVSRAEVAQVLAHPNSFWKRKVAVPPPRKPGMVFRISAAAQRSRVAPETDLCPSCGVRPSVTGTCRCS